MEVVQGSPMSVRPVLKQKLGDGRLQQPVETPGGVSETIDDVKWTGESR